MNFNKINAVAEMKQLPLVKLTDLQTDYLYTITAVKKVISKHGEGVIFDLMDTNTLFVNKRLAKYFHKNLDEFERFKKHVENGAPTLQYLGGKYNSISIQPDYNVLLEAGEIGVDFNKINAIAGVKELPLVKLASLERDYHYTITGAYKANTKFGMGVVCHLDDTKSVFLNKRLANYFEENPEEFEALQQEIDGGLLTLVYLGGEFNRLRLYSNKELVAEGLCN